MNRIQSFIRTSLIGGFGVILPMAIFIFIFRWLFNFITDLIQPISNMVMNRSDFRELVADLLVLALIILVCFMIGVVVKTKIGKFIHENLENRILKIAPGYSTIKEIVMQFMGKRRRAFSHVVLVRPYQNETLMTGFVTDIHDNGFYTVFVPTGPNPTSGFIFHVEEQNVKKINISVEEAMRSVISCGAGSEYLIKNANNQN
jgi:uncharacterized membrane protein